MATTTDERDRWDERDRRDQQGGDVVDVLVVGGGAAGLSGALTVARARRRVLVVHDDLPRNRYAAHMHAYLGLDGLPPADLLARGRAEVEGYGAEVVADRVVDVRRDGEEFRAELAGGRVVRARRVLVATGLADVLPEVPGVAGRFGRDVLHCPFCHGYEVRDRRVGVLGSGAVALHQVQLWRGWTGDVTLFLDGGEEPADADWERLAALGVRVVDGRVAGLAVAGDALTGIRLASGVELPVDALVVATRLVARLDGLDGLGLPVEPVLMGDREIGTRVVAAPDGSTTVPGVRVAGNATDPRAQVQVAAAAGLMAGAALVGELAAQDADDAVARYRAAQSAPFSARAERELAAARGDGWGVAGPAGHTGPQSAVPAAAPAPAPAPLDHGHRFGDAHGAADGHAPHGDAHGPAAGHGPMEVRHDREFWEDRYRTLPQIWSGRPNPQLVDEVADLPPGRAVDIACGEGGDALWLAGRGWTVTGVDLAQTALDRLTAAAQAAGPEVAARVRTVRSAVGDWDAGDERYDLVTSHFLHLPPADRAEGFARMAGAVAPGGTLLVVAHHASDLRTTVGRPDLPELFFEPEDVVAALEPGAWDVLVAEVRPRRATDPEGREITIRDTVVRARRR